MTKKREERFRKIAQEFSTRITDFYAQTNNWRRESEIMRRFYAGHPTQQSENNHEWKRLNNSTSATHRKDRITATAPIAMAYVNAMIGTMMREERQIVAYSVTDSDDGEANVITKGARFFDAFTDRHSIKVQQATEAAICGVGATTCSLDFTLPDMPLGSPVYELVHYPFFDRGRNGDLASDKIGYCGYSLPMYRDAMDDYLAKINKKDFIGLPASTSVDAQIEEHREGEDDHEREFLHVYFWREYKTVYDVPNPFQAMSDFILTVSDQYPAAANLIADVTKNLQINHEEPLFTFDEGDYKEFLELLENIEMLTGQEVPELDVGKRQGRIYYRAEFARNQLLTASRAYTQQCHPMSFITAYYDRTYGYHYGIMRPLAYYQRLLDEAVSNSMTYGRRATSGGNVTVSGAADKINIIKKALENGDQVTPADMQTTVAPIGTNDAAQANISNVEMLLKLIPMSMGMPPELFGIMSRGDMTSSLMSQIKQQMNATLSHFEHSTRHSTLEDGWIIRDTVIEMLRNIKEGQHSIMFALGSEKDIITLKREDLARQYTIRTIERPRGRDEQVESFKQIREIISMLPPEQQAVAAPLLIEMAPADFDAKQKLADIITPPPPDPQAQQMQMEQAAAQTRLVNAQATQLEGQAKMEAARGDVAEREALVKIQETMAKVERLLAQSQQDKAETIKTVAETRKIATETEKAEIDTLLAATQPIREATEQPGQLQ